MYIAVVEQCIAVVTTSDLEIKYMQVADALLCTHCM